MKATLGQLKSQISPSVVGLQTCSSEYLALVNKATQRLIMSPDQWWDVTGRIQINALNGCITWPRQIAAPISVAICGCPIPIRNEWFEFLESGYGLRCCNTCDHQLFDRGTAVTFKDIRNGYCTKITTTADEDADQEIGFYGYDLNGNWIRSDDGLGNIRDGYWMDIPTSAGTSVIGTKQFSAGAITQIIKPQLNGALQLWDSNFGDVTDTQQIGVYDWNDTTPSFRRSFIGGLSQQCTTQITMMYKAEFMPVQNDNDFLMIANIPAMEHMMMAVQLFSKNQMQLASGHEAKARQILDNEVNHYVPFSTVIPLRINYKEFAGGIPVLY